MADMWKSRSPPTPLDYSSILDGTFVPSNSNGNVAPSSAVASGSGSANGSTSTPNGAVNGVVNTSHLKDQRALTLKDNLELFISR